MKTWAWIKKDAKYIKSSMMMFMFSFIIAPIVLGLMYGVMYKKMMDKSVELNTMTVYRVSSESDQYGKVIDELLDSDSLPFIEVVGTEADVLEISVKEDKKGLGIIEQEGQVVIINNGPDSIEKTIVRNLMEQVVPILASKGTYNVTEQEKTAFIKEYLALSQKDYTTTEEIVLTRKLNSFELMLVSVFSAMSLFIGITFASNFLRQRENALTDRLVSINVSSRGIYVSSVISVFVFSLITVLTYSIIGYGIILKMNILNLRIIVASMLQAGFITALYGFSIGLFRRETVYKNSITPIVMVVMILGGSFFPAELFFDKLWIMEIMPNYNILIIVREVLLGSSIGALIKPILILTVEIVAFIAIGALRFQVHERGKKYA